MATLCFSIHAPDEPPKVFASLSVDAEAPTEREALSKLLVRLAASVADIDRRLANIVAGQTKEQR